MIISRPMGKILDAGSLIPDEGRSLPSIKLSRLPSAILFFQVPNIPKSQYLPD